MPPLPALRPLIGRPVADFEPVPVKVAVAATAAPQKTMIFSKGRNVATAAAIAPSASNAPVHGADTFRPTVGWGGAARRLRRLDGLFTSGLNVMRLDSLHARSR